MEYAQKLKDSLIKLSALSTKDLELALNNAPLNSRLFPIVAHELPSQSLLQRQIRQLFGTAGKNDAYKAEGFHLLDGVIYYNNITHHDNILVKWLNFTAQLPSTLDENLELRKTLVNGFNNTKG